MEATTALCSGPPCPMQMPLEQPAAAPPSCRALPGPAAGRAATCLLVLGLVLLTGCLGAGFRSSDGETWVAPELSDLGEQRYAVLPVDCPQEVIPADAYGPWRSKRLLELTLHLRSRLTEGLEEAGLTISDPRLLEAALGRGELEIPYSVRMLGAREREQLALRLRAESVVETRVLDGSAERLTITLRAVHLASGEVIWRSTRTDSYGNERSSQVERLLERSLDELRKAGL